MLILISLLVLVHELGHYLAARAFGIQVSHFGIGLPIGPVLYETKCGDTKITIHAFLLGGYVSFPDDDEDNEDIKDLPLDSPKRFKNKKPWQKAVVVSAGVFANVVFAMFLVMFCAAYYHKLPSSKYDVFISDFSPEVKSNIMQSGLKKGDKIISVNDSNIINSYQFIFLVQKSKFFDGLISLTTADKKLNELKNLNPDISEVVKKGQKIKLPKMTPKEKVTLTFYLSELFNENTGISSPLYERLIKEKIITTKLNASFLKIEDYILITIGSSTLKEKELTKEIINNFKNINFDKDIFELNKKREILNIILRDESLPTMTTALSDNIINYNYHNLDTVEDIESFTFEKYKNVINNLNFNNYTITTINNEDSN